MDISNYSKEQLKKLIDRIRERGLDYIIRNQKLYIFRITYGVSSEKRA